MAKIVLADLLFNVSASTREFEKQMRQVQRRFDGMAKKIEGVGKAATKAFAPVTAALAALSVAGARFANTLDDVASKLKIDVESLQALRVAADEGSVSNERLEKGLRNIADRSLMAANGNRSYRQAIEDLGYSTEAFLSLPIERRFEAIGRSYVNATDKAKAHAAVMQLVGTMSGPELIKTLEAVGIEGFDALAIRARAAGLVVSQEAVTKLSDFIGTLDKLKIRLQVIGAEIAARLLTQFERLDKALGITGKIKQLSDWFKGLSDNSKTLALNLAIAAAAFGPLTLLASKMVSLTGGVVVNILKVSRLIAPLLPAFKAITGFLLGWPAVIAAAVAGIFLFVDGVNGIGDALVGVKMRTRLQLFAAELAQTAVQWGAKLLVTIVDSGRIMRAVFATGIAWIVHQFQNGLVEKIGAAIKTIWGFWSNMWKSTGMLLYDIVTSAFNAFINQAKKGLNVIIRAANNIPGFNFDEFDVNGSEKNITEMVSGALQRAVAPFQTALEGGVKDAMGNFDPAATFKKAMGDGDSLIGGAIKDAAGAIDGALTGRVARLRGELDAMSEATADIKDNTKKTEEEFQKWVSPIKESQRLLEAELGVLRLRAFGQDALAQAVEDELAIRAQIADIMEKTNWSEQQAEQYLREKLRLEREIAGVKDNERALTREERKQAEKERREQERAEKRRLREMKDPRISLGEGQGKKRWSEMSGQEQRTARERFNQGFGADGKMRPEIQAKAMLGGISPVAQGGGQPPAAPQPVAITPGAAAVQQQVQTTAAQQGKGGADSNGLGQIASLMQQLIAALQPLPQTIATSFPA